MFLFAKMNLERAASPATEVPRSQVSHSVQRSTNSWPSRTQCLEYSDIKQSNSYDYLTKGNIFTLINTTTAC